MDVEVDDHLLEQWTNHVLRCDDNEALFNGLARQRRLGDGLNAVQVGRPTVVVGQIHGVDRSSAFDGDKGVDVDNAAL